MRYLTLLLLALLPAFTYAQNAQGGYGAYYISMQGQQLPVSVEPYSGGVEIAIIAAADLYPKDFKLFATSNPSQRKALSVKYSTDYRVGNVLFTHLVIPEGVETYYVMLTYQGKPVGMAVVCKDTNNWIKR